MRPLLVALLLLLASTSASASILPSARLRLIAGLASPLPGKLRLDAAPAGGGADAALAGSVLGTWSGGLAFVIVGAVFILVPLITGDDSDINGVFYAIGGAFIGTGVLMMVGSWLCWNAQGGGGDPPALAVLDGRTLAPTRADGPRQRLFGISARF